MKRENKARIAGVLTLLGMLAGLYIIGTLIPYAGEVIAALFFAAFVMDKIDPVDERGKSRVAETSERDPR